MAKAFAGRRRLTLYFNCPKSVWAELVEASAFNRFAFTPPAHLPRDVPEKSADFPFGAPRDHPELRSFVVFEDGFSRSTRKATVFFRPITQRIEVVGALLENIKFTVT
jgi:hypothetical protein